MSELALIAANPSALDQAADPSQFVIQACERAKAWLAEVLEHGDIEQIVELKSQAEAIRVYTLSKQLGKDAELSAAEIVRRAERGIGIAIRRGQEAGEIRKHGSNQHEFPLGEPRHTKEFFSNHKEMSDTYAVTDGVDDEDFETAIKQAKEEVNLSRANVVRKVKGEEGPVRPATAGRKRRPITDSAKDFGWALRRDVERIEKLLTDDRLAEHKDKVAAHLRGHLTYAIEALDKALARITHEGE